MNRVIPLQVGQPRVLQSTGSLVSVVLQALSPRLEFFHVDPGEMLFSPGQSPADVLILLDGNVKISADSADGRTYILEIAGPEEILGLSSVILGEAYDKCATTLTLCRLASMRSHDFDSLLRSSHRMMMLALSQLNDSYKQACNHVQRLGEPSVTVRLAKALLHWARNGHPTEQGMRFHIPLSHNEIGEYIGTRRETVTRALGELQRRGLIKIQGALYTIVDRNGLETCSGVPDAGADGLA